MKRREFLAAGGAIVVYFVCPTVAAQDALVPLPGSLKVEPLIDGWIRISDTGGITVFTGKAELGQGIKTALIQIAAEELVVSPDSIDIVTADTERTANEGFTSGSHSMQDSGTAVRCAAAQARVLLLRRAAVRLQAPLESLSVAEGIVTGPAGTVSYATLCDAGLLHVRAAPQSVFLDWKIHRVMGRSMPRVDIRRKVTGGAAYVQDLRPAGMVHGRIVRPPSKGALLVAPASSVFEGLPGVVKVVVDGRFIGILAEREFDAVKAMRTVAGRLEWTEAKPLPDQATVFETVRGLPSNDYVIAQQGDPEASAPNTISASYQRPYQMHASIGPSCAVAQLIDGKYTVWTHTQGVYPLRHALAELVGVDASLVHCIHAEGSGCYGHNGADDVAADAVLLARAYPGQPVRVQWMREDEHGWEPYGPAMIGHASASLDGSGNISRMTYEMWSNTHSTRPGGAGDLLAGQYLATPFAPTTPKPIPQPEGGGDRNGIPLYQIPNQRVVHHFLPDMPLRVSAMRSLGAYLNIFSIESFIDELALSATLDPVEFRLRHMPNQRARDVIQLAADRFGWNTFERQPARGRGFAFAQYKNLAAYFAIACEVEIWRERGEVRVVRVVSAVDSGEIVSPDGVTNQIEGGILQSISWTTLEEVTFDRTRITSLDWGGYPILRFADVPEIVEVHLIDRPGQPFLGTGEAAQGPTAAAIANAIADATGVRIRQLPLSKTQFQNARQSST
jgi:nicotinate dehydrogenase subunit B